MLHHSIYTTSTGHKNDVLEVAGLMREGDLVDIIDESGAVDVVFTSHDHNYERTKNIKGYRSKPVGDLQEAGHHKLDNAYAEQGSGRLDKQLKVREQYLSLLQEPERRTEIYIP